MKRAPAEDIVNFLSFSGPARDATAAIARFTPRDWSRVQRWMQDAGLVFFFLKRLMDTNMTQLVPAPVLSRLQCNFASNKMRTADLSRRFDSINRSFDHAGVRYAVLKGFSLVPEFCPSAALRHQADLDYLIDLNALPVAQRALIHAGYAPQQSVSAKEFIFVSPGAKASRDDSQYSAQAGHAVELHTDVWDNEMHRVPRIPQLLGADQATRRHWNDCAFPALSDADAFLLQVLHACHHLFTQWIRMSSLFEIGYFLNRRVSDTALWSVVQERVQDNPIIREFIVIVAELVARLFAPQIPPLIQDWAEKVRPATRVWLETYARSWAFCELPVHEFSLFPRSKFVLFLQQQFSERSSGDRGKPDHSSHGELSLGTKSLWLPRTDWWKRKRLLRRGIYYALAQTRYVCEIPRWRRLTRTSLPAPAGNCLAVSKKAS